MTCFKLFLKPSKVCYYFEHLASILYDLFDGKYLMSVPSSNLIVLICLLRRLVLAMLIRLPYSKRAPVASHFDVSSYSPMYLFKR